MSSQTASGYIPGLSHFLETECCGPLDSLEHTDLSPLAAWKLHLPLSGPEDVVLLLRLIWIRKWRGLRATARGLRTEA